MGIMLSLLNCQQQPSAPVLEAGMGGGVPAAGFYDFGFPTLDGETFDFARLRGKRVVVVNTASRCGYTPQYEGLQSLYEKYGGEDFEIIGFPSNDFGQQEPGSDEDIKAFCEKNFGVSFPVMSKSSVKGPDQNEVFRWLTKEAGDVEVSWNFNKFLVDGKGRVVAHLPPAVKPMDERLQRFARGEGWKE